MRRTFGILIAMSLLAAGIWLSMPYFLPRNGHRLHIRASDVYPPHHPLDGIFVVWEISSPAELAMVEEIKRQQLESMPLVWGAPGSTQSPDYIVGKCAEKLQREKEIRVVHGEGSARVSEGIKLFTYVDCGFVWAEIVRVFNDQSVVLDQRNAHYNSGKFRDLSQKGGSK